MPFLRLTRDRRGFENTFLLHANRPGDRPRLLYWYRTAPGVLLGRAPLDEDAIRTIEEQHPDIDFDWPAILALSAVMTPEDEAPPPRRERRDKPPRQRDPGRERQQGGQRREGGQPAFSEAEELSAESAGAADAAESLASEPALTLRPSQGHPKPRRGAGEDAESSAESTGGVDADHPDPSAGPAFPDDAEPDAPQAEVPRQRTYGLLEELVGREIATRLRARHSELGARIHERYADRALRDAWLKRAEPLNPDLWLTPDAILDGVRNADGLFERIRTALLSHSSRE